MKKYFIFLFSLYLINIGYTQETCVLQGKIVDKVSGQPLSNSNVVIKGTNYGGAASEDGSFIIEHIPPGIYDIEATRIGYQPEIKKRIRLETGAHKNITIQLQPTIVQLAPVEVQADRFSMKYETEVSQIGFQQINPRRIKYIPGALDDVARSVQIFGSAMPASDYNSYFAVRGGSPEQNLVIMDGVIIPNPYRFRLLLGGGLSIFDPNTTEDVRLHIGGFSAEFGNFLSSVLEVDTRDGNRHRIAGKGSVNLIDASAVLEGPILNGKGSWLMSGRRTYYDLLANRFTKSNSTYPNTYDLNGKIVYNINGTNKLSFHSMVCKEGTEMMSQMDGAIDITEDSKILVRSMNWQSSPSEKLTHRTTISYYEEQFEFVLARPADQYYLREVYADLVSDLSQIAIREDVIYELSDDIWMTRGFYYSSSRSDIDFAMPVQSLLFARRDLPPPMQLNHHENYLVFYMDDIYKLKPYFHLKFGLRYDRSDLFEKSALNPRVSVWYKLSEKIAVEGFWGMCTQNPNALSSFLRSQAINMSNDFESLEPEKSTHLTGGIHYQFSENIESKIEFYHRKLTDLLLPEDSENKNALNIGNGYSRGVEWYLHKIPGENDWLSGIISYSYGVSKFQDERDKRWQPMSFDRRHSFSAMCNVKLSKNLSANILWRVTSGLPHISSYGVLLNQASSPYEFLKGEGPLDYFPPYHRFDIRLNYEHRSGVRVFNMYFDITNIYNHKNVYDQVWHINRLQNPMSDLRQIELRTVYMMPIVPSFGMSFEF